MKTTLGLSTLFISAMLACPARAFEPDVLYSFQRQSRSPCAALVKARDGNFYGTAAGNRPSDFGSVFKFTADGAITTLVSFNGTNGSIPKAPLTLANDGNFYGTTFNGGLSGDGTPTSGYGTVFRVNTNGVLTSLVSFFGTNGANPAGGLVVGNDGQLYGTTAAGGETFYTDNPGLGTVFRITTTGVLTTLASFYGTNGANPLSELLWGNDGYFYGTTFAGGSNNYGTVFKVSATGNLLSLSSFSAGTNGYSPIGGLALGRDGSFYGTTSRGGWGLNGAVFKISRSGTLKPVTLLTNGASPSGTLLLGPDGNFYGTTQAGDGTVFKMTTDRIVTTLVFFDFVNGSAPMAGLILGADGQLYGTTRDGGAAGSGTIFRVNTNGTFVSLASLPGANGTSPVGRLEAGSDGSLYGVTYQGGAADSGTVFKWSTNRTLHVLAQFNGTNGARPQAGLLMADDGSLYGTTPSGGPNPRPGKGTVFNVTTNGLLTSLVSFNGTNGFSPHGGLITDHHGNFYGTTASGGAEGAGYGTVFRVSRGGMLVPLASFFGTNAQMPMSDLVFGNDGNLYGTTFRGGSGDNGTVFKVSTNGLLSILVSFSGTDGAWPAQLASGTDGTFFGTTVSGGRSNCGTVFKVTTNGVLTSLISFNGTNGQSPYSRLTLGNDGNFYGTTRSGGIGFDGSVGSGYGTVFRVSTNGTLTPLVLFTGRNGMNPEGLIFGKDGNLYGLTYGGGPNGGGTIFGLLLAPKFTGIVRQPGGNILLTGAGLPNNAYNLWATTNVALPFSSWMLLTNASFNSNGTFSYFDHDVQTNLSRFYRLSVP